MSRVKVRLPDKHILYEKSVQTPDSDVQFMKRVFKAERGRLPQVLREDFCGTAALCCEWIKMFPEEEFARNREMIYEELHDSFAALVHESIEPEDYQILVEHILDLLQNKDLRLIVMAFYVGIGKIDNELYPEEAGVMLKAADIWGIDMEQVTQDKEGRVYELIKEYDSSYQSIYRQLLDFTLRYTGDPRGQRLIDIGCFTGRFLDEAMAVGFTTYGVEYQADASRIANEKHQGRVCCGPIENYSHTSLGFFDVATLFGVIEHVTEPKQTILTISKLLKKGGISVIQTPNTLSMPARLLGRWWPGYAPIEHIYYFSSLNIRMLLNRYGFHIIKIFRHWKTLPIAYVYRQFQNFGPEIYRFLNKFISGIPGSFLEGKLPFYGGEMIIVAQKK